MTEPKADSTSTWPGAFGLYKVSRDAMRLNVWNYVGLTVLGGAISNILQHLWRPAVVLGWLISVAISVSTTYLLLATVRQQKCTIQQALQKINLNLFVNMFLLTILVGISVALSLLALIVPFFFVMPRLVLAPYYLIDKNMGVIDAYKASWNKTKGHASKVWGIIGVNLLFALLFVTIIGIPFAIYFLIMYSAASALLYLHIQKEKPASPATVADAPYPTASA